MQVQGLTDIGQKRDSNQDTFYVHQLNDQTAFAILCDGMGGQRGGQIASALASQTIAERLRAGILEDMDDNAVGRLMEDAIGAANLAVFQEASEESGYKGMGTTAVVAVVRRNKAHIAHVGDSRAYLLKEYELCQLTRDHSLVQELLESGKISSEESKNHPNKNIITRVVGINPLVDIDSISLPFDPGDKLLLCSDGLTNMVSDQVIETILRGCGAGQACERLVALSNQAGGADNITVVVIE